MLPRSHVLPISNAKIQNKSRDIVRELHSTSISLCFFTAKHVITRHFLTSMVRLMYRAKYLALLCVSVVLSACEVGQADSEPYYHLVQDGALQQRQTYTAVRQFVGHVQAKQKVDLAFELPGALLDVLVDEGDEVLAGQVIMRLDTRLLEDEREQLLALLSEIEAKQALVAIQIERQRRLQQKGLAAQQRRDELDAEAAVLAAQLSRQQSRLSALAVRLSQSSVTAPYDGFVSARYFDPGAVVTPGQPVLRVLQQGRLEARVGVPASLVETLQLASSGGIDNKTGDAAGVTVSLTDQRSVNAFIIAIGKAIDPITRTVSVRLALPEGLNVVDGELLFLHVDQVHQQAGFWIPVSALSSSVRGMWNVLVLKPSVNDRLFTLEARSVELLHRRDGYVFVRGGIEQGERYVMDGLHSVVAGQQVRATSQHIMTSGSGPV